MKHGLFVERPLRNARTKDLREDQGSEVIGILVMMCGSERRSTYIIWECIERATR